MVLILRSQTRATTCGDHTLPELARAETSREKVPEQSLGLLSETASPLPSCQGRLGVFISYRGDLVPWGWFYRFSRWGNRFREVKCLAPNHPTEGEPKRQETFFLSEPCREHTTPSLFGSCNSWWPSHRDTPLSRVVEWCPSGCQVTRRPLGLMAPTARLPSLQPSLLCDRGSGALRTEKPIPFWGLVLSGFTLSLATFAKSKIFFRPFLCRGDCRGAQGGGVPGPMLQVTCDGHSTPAHLGSGGLGPGPSPALCPGASRSTVNHSPSA